MRLPGHVLNQITDAEPTARNASQGLEPITLTLTLRRDDEQGFENYLHEVYDRSSPQYRRFLSQRELAERFGPSVRTYNALARFLREHGFTTVSASANRLTLTVRGTRAEAEQAFDLEIHDYRIGDTQFFANDVDPALPTSLGSHVQAITGLSNLARPVAVRWALYNFLVYLCKIANTGNTDKSGLLTCLTAAKNASGYAGTEAKDPPGWEELDGTGQTVGLIEFDTYQQSDVSNFLTLTGATTATSANVTEVPVNGGATAGPDQDEVLLDIDTVQGIAPNAKVIVYDAPFSGAGSFQAVFNAAITGGATVISNSWAYCEDQTTLADVQSLDTIFKSAAASGISVFNGAGDSGSTCLDGSANTVAVPADAPDATAVGGSSFITGPGYTYGSETWWNGSAATPQTGQGGFGVSKFFSSPSFQAGLNTATNRSVPDVVANADPALGVQICQQSNGGCPNGLVYGGTSMSAPAWAAMAALLNEALGKNIGAFNQAIYPFAGTSAFQGATSLGSDFAHVGLGSPNLNQLYLKLAGLTNTAVSATNSGVYSYVMAPIGASATVSADGQSQGYVNVRLLDTNGNPVGGKTVTLTAASNNSAVITPASAVTSSIGGVAVFSLTDLVADNLVLTATDTTDGITVNGTGTVTFVGPPAANGGITANPSTVAADGQTAATIIVTLTDALSRPSPGKLVSIQTGGSHAVVSGPSPAVTDVNGQIQFTATDQVNETVTFTAIDVTDSSLPIPGSAVVTYSGSTNAACGVGTVPVAATGYSISTYISGLPAAATVFYNNVNLGCPGADNPSFTSAGNVLVADGLTGGIYQLGLSGGTASASNLLNTLTPILGGFVYGKDGSVYAPVGTEGAEIVQINPATGAITRVVASGLTCPAGLSVDPLSGDLFFDDECTGGGTDDPHIYRVVDPANTNPSNPTTVVAYATLPSTPNGGMAFAPNGTLYAVSGYYYTQTAPVEQISGTNASTVTVTPVSGVTSDFPVAIGVVNADGSAQSLIAEPSGSLYEIPIANPSAEVLLASASPGVGVTGPDGCLYSARYDTIYRLAPTSGVCNFAPTSPAPAMTLSPSTVATNPAQGSAQTFSATLKNVSSASGVPVLFTVTGANPGIHLVLTNASGVASFTYIAALTGADSVTATTTVGSTPLTSNSVKLSWGAGKHVTFLNVDPSPQAGTINQPVNVVGSLVDVSVSPVAALSGQPVTLTLGNSSCNATTNSTGLATCAVTPAAVGTSTLTGTFAGSSQYTAATAAAAFNVSGPPTQPPTVTLTVNPTSVAAGDPATLTWSSTNATSCTASGAWSGSEPTSGTETVTPSAVSNYSYTLTCSGNGGTANASATLTANLVTVNVHARSGGGALTWELLPLLGLLIRRRRRGAVALMSPLVLAGILAVGMQPVRADPLDSVYLGLRVGSMPQRLDAGDLASSLTSAGYGDVGASVHNDAIGATIYGGYDLTPQAAIELGYSYRNAGVATVSATLPGAVSVAALLHDTSDLLRGYGSLYSASFRWRQTLAPRWTLDPRLGVFLWDTRVHVEGNGLEVSTDHAGGGITAGIGTAYRLWRGLRVGVGVDYYRGEPKNIATLYSGSLEWHFGE